MGRFENHVLLVLAFTNTQKHKHKHESYLEKDNILSGYFNYENPQKIVTRSQKPKFIVPYLTLVLNTDWVPFRWALKRASHPWEMPSDSASRKAHFVFLLTQKFILESFVLSFDLDPIAFF